MKRNLLCNELKVYLATENLCWCKIWSTYNHYVLTLSKRIFRNKATSLACGVLDELMKVIKIKQLPVVLMSFSLGLSGCMYKVLQILNGKMQEELGLDEYRLIRECICGKIYDSATVDFTGKMATRFLHHHTAQRLFSPTKITSWMRKVLTSGLDVVLPSRSEAQHAEYWQSLAWVLFLYFHQKMMTLPLTKLSLNFSLCLKELGVDARHVKWSNSPHVCTIVITKLITTPMSLSYLARQLQYFPREGYSMKDQKTSEVPVTIYQSPFAVFMKRH
ncbi:uncharacterized protein LOC103969174 isoform X4 [Musa acuminata AAA Group]|uniref:uncharacterized protein LOC103969174 isoform X4 n=1 Tax=Musa acuminata AAA Group TaxID=214697 RepID=UPI0031D47F81